MSDLADKFCAPARRVMSDAMDGEPLPLASRAVLRFHLTVCPHCKRVWRELEETRAALRDLKDSEPEL